MYFYFFFNDTATTEIYTYVHTLSRHDALPISLPASIGVYLPGNWQAPFGIVLVVDRLSALMLVLTGIIAVSALLRSEEHTSELQSLMRISYAVFCLKKKNKNYYCQYTLTHYITIHTQYSNITIYTPTPP